jgi:hypothetical protein
MSIHQTLPAGKVLDDRRRFSQMESAMAYFAQLPRMDRSNVCRGASSVEAGEAIFAVGNHDGPALAAFGIVALASGAWRNSRGGAIDEFLRLDLAAVRVAH